MATEHSFTWFDDPTETSRVSDRTGRQSSLPIVDRAGGLLELTRREQPRFMHEGLLGTGGTGEVIRAADLDIGRRVAIKRLHNDRQRASDIARFVREIQLVGSLEHPNIVPLHDVGTDEDDRVYAVMKFVDGETLTELIDRLRAGDEVAHARWDFSARARLMLEICRAIAFAHEREVLHRDIKPSNVMVGPEGEAQILDWGLAKRRGVPELPPSDEPIARVSAEVSDEAPTEVDLERHGRGSSDFDTVQGAVFGTPPYMSPEQARGEVLDERSDVFALGLLFWELLTLGEQMPGVHDPQLQVLKAMGRDVPHPLSLPVQSSQGQVPSHLAWFVYRATRPDPEDRFSTVDEMIEELRSLLDGLFEVRCSATLQRRVFTALARLSDRFPMSLPVVGMSGVAGLVGLGVAIGMALG